MARIIGNTTATPNHRPDWEQTDETKADYIKNKPIILTEEDVVNLINTNGGGSSGAPGVGIANAEINALGELVLTYSDGTSVNLGIVIGQDGERGTDGINGVDGVSVVVTNVSESTDDGGSNIVTFSDGKTLTVKNGSKGSTGEKGDTPIKGTDYWTEADQAEVKTFIDQSVSGLDGVLRNILTAIQNSTSSWNTVAEIEQIIVSYLETQTVGEVEG